LSFRFAALLAVFASFFAISTVAAADATTPTTGPVAAACSEDAPDCEDDGSQEAETPTMTLAYGQAFIRLAWGYRHTSIPGLKGSKLKLVGCKQLSATGHSCRVAYRMTVKAKGKPKRTSNCAGTITAEYIGQMDTFDRRVASFKGACVKPRRKLAWSTEDCWNANDANYQRELAGGSGECVPEDEGDPTGGDDSADAGDTDDSAA
jgi:hypothetical protein